MGAALLLLGAASPSSGQQAPAAGSPAFVEVGRLPVLGDTGEPETAVSATQADQSGWLIVNRKSRWGYQVFESDVSTIVQSFHLDSLSPGRRVWFWGGPVVGGSRAIAGNGGTIGQAGEIVHAVDEEAGRIYLPLQERNDGGAPTELPAAIAASMLGGATNSSDANRPANRYVVIDEARLHTGRDDFAASFDEPTFPGGWLRSLVVDPVRKTSGFGHLVSIVTTGNVNNAPPGIHQVRQWDVSQVVFPEDPKVAQATSTQLGPIRNAPGTLPITITACAGSSMANGGAGVGNLEWGTLVTAEGAFVACQGSEGSARAVLVPFGEGEEVAYPLSRPVTDVLVDPGAAEDRTRGIAGRPGRLLFKSRALTGQTWWVFDSGARRFVGALAATVRDYGFASGIDEATGRLYMLVPDYPATSGGREFGVRGGLQVADTRLDPVPPAENVAPELAYPAVFRIVVDSPTRRVFVRRGKDLESTRVVYPGTQATEPAPVEGHYLVLRDDKPVPEEIVEGPEADRRFTTNTPEAEGVTEATYQASGSGFGARTLLVGGIDAATGRSGSGSVIPECDKDDREVLVGQVESATLSDASGAAAGAASLAADAKTEEQAGRLGPSCNENHGAHAPDTTAAEFDGPDEDEESDFRTRCVGDHDPGATRPPDARLRVFHDHTPDDGEPTVDETTLVPGSRAGYHADVDCDQEGESVAAESAGAFVVAPGVTVGHARSEVHVERRDSGGVVVTVESIAREVEIAEVGRIGVVRVEATSAAAGRDGTAEGRYERKVCGVDIPRVMTKPHCLSEYDEANLEASFKARFSGQAELRFRSPDEVLLEGSISGYRSGVQRRGIELFQDASINKDSSLTVPGLELVLFRGDSTEHGVGRQIVQLAGAQAGTSYGIYCLHGEAPAGGCATGPGRYEEPPPEPTTTVDDEGNLVTGDGGTPGSAGSAGGRSLLRTLTELVKAPFRVLADVARLLFANPREFALMATVWALLYLPCWLGERRRTLAAVAARRLAVGAGA